ncbi:uncharacterized protein J4E87_010722 [Alternaria ethzedia]|uniref:uncharacterized protein n=1 Tax=Alternaria ethzedia TaxID=181014 RepID=UPI0020C4F0BD|nr:uncharacterized protein J4E87_010722 [Alternaria ethzedia]KAI4610788.1 hypothetical protein J4E87_010722 [Alternaria ethzedia]
MWEWEAYTPGAEVYDQLWRIRKEPATVTARLPNVCPMSNARTRILHRRQTEDRFKRELYTVEVTYTGGPGSARDGIALTQLEDVDLQRILQFVSPAELERYETEQFRLEAEAEAIAMRTEAEDLARRQLRKNAKGPNASKGSRMLSALAFSVEPTPRSRGRPRATRGKCRGRARGVEPTRGLVVSSQQLKNDMHEQLVDSEPMVFDRTTEHIGQPTQTSPNTTRSAFVANSALSVSPIPRRVSISVPRRELSEVSEPSEPEDVDYLALSDNDAKSTRGDLPSLAIEVGNTGSSKDPLAASDQDDIIPSQPASPQFKSDGYVGSRITSMRTLYPGQQSLKHNNEDDAEADATEEFAVEAIVAHFHEHEKNYYLVKWEGYEDSHDWLPEEDLEGAADLVTEYKERIGWRNKKVEIR